MKKVIILTALAAAAICATSAQAKDLYGGKCQVILDAPHDSKKLGIVLGPMSRGYEHLCTKIDPNSKIVSLIALSPLSVAQQRTMITCKGTAGFTFDITMQGLPSKIDTFENCSVYEKQKQEYLDQGYTIAKGKK
jgi:hypothetical protein